MILLVWHAGLMATLGLVPGESSHDEAEAHGPRQEVIQVSSAHHQGRFEFLHFVTLGASREFEIQAPVESAFARLLGPIDRASVPRSTSRSALLFHDPAILNSLDRPRG
ncbi:MAG: hypothetical protein KF841_10960 [Phycisphaerae bacterium]|nr:hypothetical protein [Phycisphaerae bacterium]